MTHGGKLPEIAKMLSESTGRTFEHQEVYKLVQKLQKLSGEEKIEFLNVGMQLGYGREWRQERLES